MLPEAMKARVLSLLTPEDSGKSTWSELKKPARQDGQSARSISFKAIFWTGMGVVLSFAISHLN